MRSALWAVIALGLSCVAATAADADQCKTDPRVVGECYDIRARLFVSNGTPSVRLWPVGTKRILAVSGPEGAPMMPTALRARLTDATARVFGDYTVCPLSDEQPGQMASVCIESATNLRTETQPRD